MEIKRYRITPGENTVSAEVDPKGVWVKYADVQHLLEERPDVKLAEDPQPQIKTEGEKSALDALGMDLEQLPTDFGGAVERKNDAD